MNVARHPHGRKHLAGEKKELDLVSVEYFILGFVPL